MAFSFLYIRYEIGTCYEKSVDLNGFLTYAIIVWLRESGWHFG